MDLFTVTAPLAIRLADGRDCIMAERFPHPEGLLFFEPWWHQTTGDERVHLVPGAIRGEGPWRIGEAVVRVLGCHGSDPRLAGEYAQWQAFMTSTPEQYPTHQQVLLIAGSYGVRFAKR